MLKSISIIATPPGATIKEQLLDRGLTQKEFAIRMDMSEKHISRLINGEVQLTPEMAIRLEMVLGIPANFWNRLEAAYREKLIKAKEENEMLQDQEIVKKFPYAKMAKIGWVPKTRSANEKVINLRKFFEIVKLELIYNTKLTKIAYRRLSDTEKSDYSLLAWAQEAKIEARTIDTSPIDVMHLINSVNEIRSMTTMMPEDFCPLLKCLLANCGIALIFLPHIGGSFLHGATFYDGNKIVMGLTVRGKDADRFWFSLFHEIGHIVYGHINNLNGTIEVNEIEADEYAKNILIPSEDFNQFTNHNDFSKKSVLDFANKEDILPGIVVGRLQKEGFIKYDKLNDLKTRYEICDE